MRILVLSAPIVPPLYVERDGRVITLGRDVAANVRLPDPTVSMHHATLRKRGDRFLLTDEGSTNGTALVGADGGQPVWLGAGSPRVVREGDRLLLGSVLLELRLESEADGSPSENLAQDLVTASLAALGHRIDPASVEAALSELSTLGDERMAEPDATSSPTPVVDRAGVVSGGRVRMISDVLIAALALLVIAVSGLGLHFFVLGR